MTKRVIVAFCKTNLALLESTQTLFAVAEQVAADEGEAIEVRCLRCLTKCHTCGTTAYVKVGPDILSAPDPAVLRESIYKALAVSERRSRRPARVET